jgi:Family of unknown function (DUF5989)
MRVGLFLGDLTSAYVNAVSKKIDLLEDLSDFMRVRKKFWLAPIVIVMILLGALLVLAQGSAVAPFIYTLF